MSDTYKRAASEDYVTRAITTHANNSNIHVSTEEKAAWNAKYAKDANGIPKTDLAEGVQASLDKADTALQEHQSLAAYVNGGVYDGDAKKILLQHDGETVAAINATAFIKDGMVDSVEITGGNLVISFNTDAGIEDIEIPLTDIFNPSNYYDKTAADGRFVQKEAGKGLFSGSYNDLSDKPTIPDVSGKANTSDLPYALETITPTQGTPVWMFSGSPDLPADVAAALTVAYNDLDGYYLFQLGGQLVGAVDGYSADATTVVCQIDTANADLWAGTAYAGTVTAVKITPLVFGLLDRAGNRVVVSGDTTLTLPDANPGHLRDFLVRLEISGSTVPTITFAAPTGETITYETDGDEFPVPDEAGDWLYSFTESCVAHKFAVSLKKVNEVLQGGS